MAAILKPTGESAGYPVYRVTKKSPLSGKEHSMEMALSADDYLDWLDGKPVQDAFPYLTADQREFLMTGITPEEWEQTFGED